MYKIQESYTPKTILCVSTFVHHGALHPTCFGGHHYLKEVNMRLCSAKVALLPPTDQIQSTALSVVSDM